MLPEPESTTPAEETVPPLPPEAVISDVVLTEEPTPVEPQPEAISIPLPATETVPPEPPPFQALTETPSDSSGLASLAGATAGVSVARSLATQRGPGWSLWLGIILVPYAIAATGLLLYFLSQLQTLKAIPHPLENLADQGIYEDYYEGKRPEAEPGMEKANQPPTNSKFVELTKPLLSELPVTKLGETRKLGDLEIQPLTISKEPIKFSFPKDAEAVALVLKLKIKNIGTQIFHPEDASFNRAFTTADNRLYTFLQLADKRYYGAVADPHQQQLTLPPLGMLKPGEIGEMQVVAVKDATGRSKAPDALAGLKGPFTWYIHLRKGKETIKLTNGKTRSIWVTAMFPVSFDASSVK